MTRRNDPMFFIIAMFLAAFILLFIPSISIPVTNTIYLLRLDFISSGLLGTLQANGRIEFGVWGYCVFPIRAVALGNSVGLTSAQCSPKKLGYTFDNELVNLTGLKQAADLISSTTSTGLVLHPISCALAFIALVACIIAVYRPHRFWDITALIAGYLGAVLATIAFIFDCVLYGVARHKLTIVSIQWGNAISLTIAGAVALWMGALGLTSRLRLQKKQQAGWDSSPAVTGYTGQQQSYPMQQDPYSSTGEQTRYKPYPN